MAPAGGRALALAAGLSLGPAVGVGLARFGYGLVLPAMRSALGWSYAGAGALNAANTAGYLLGAAAAGSVVARLGARSSFRASLLVTVLALTATGFAPSTAVLVALRLLVGVSGALVFIAGATLAAHAASLAGERAARVIGMYFGGVGVGIVGSGALLPFLVPADAPARWPAAWWAMAALGAVATVVAYRAAGVTDETVAASRRGLPAGLGNLRFALVAYLLYGLGYIGYMTFIVAFVQEGGRGPMAVAGTWTLLGVAAAATGLVWDRPLSTLPAGRGLALVLLVLAVGAALPLASRAVPVVALSGVLFGGSFLGVISAITRMIRQRLAPPEWGRAIAAATLVFAAGQVVGPVLTGWLADRAGGLAESLAASVALIAAGAALATRQEG